VSSGGGGGGVCGGAVNAASVNAGSGNCQSQLWGPTGNADMHCYAYGGPYDPCALSYTNDIKGSWKDKDPSECTGDTFYLWDEPDTQSGSYAQAGKDWVDYSTTWSSEINDMRNRGVKFTTPLIKSGGDGVIGTNLHEFWSASANVNDNIDVVAVNAFCESKDNTNSAGDLDCAGGASYIVEQIKSAQSSAGINKPAYITNWSFLGDDSTFDNQKNAIEGAANFFIPGCPVKRVYWFGATDYGGGSAKGANSLTTSSGGVTLGEVWNEACNES
jgi:hypothetical protein